MIVVVVIFAIVDGRRRSLELFASLGAREEGRRRGGGKVFARKPSLHCFSRWVILLSRSLKEFGGGGGLTGVEVANSEW